MSSRTRSGEMKPLKHIVVSVSGGKDSTAVALLALDGCRADVRLVFADTGHEHAETYGYVRDYLPGALGLPVEEVRADFTEQIAGKRRYVAEVWPTKGVPVADVERALSVLYPTGNPFLDLCLWKGRFPSRMAQFCTQELKRRPLEAYLLDLLGQGCEVESWRGVRRDESQNRKDAAEREKAAEGWTIVQPIAHWTAEDVVSFVLGRGVELNPLYRQGMTRVGCMPCINCRKDELAEIAVRFPAEVDRVREWERLVSAASKRGATAFFTDGILQIPTGRIVDGGYDDDGEPHGMVPEMRDETTAEIVARLNIDARIRWAKTTRGGKQYALLPLANEPSACASVYGLCE